MSTVTRECIPLCRCLEAAYLIDDMTVEIADGVHLPKSLLQFVYVQDPQDSAMYRLYAERNADRIHPGQLGKRTKGNIEDGVAKLPDRTAFAGSVATTDRLVRTMVNVAEVPLIEAVKMMTLTPARIMKIDQQKGSVRKGKDADLVVFDNNINVSYTILEGNVIYGN